LSRLGVLWRLKGDTVVVNLAGTGLFGAALYGTGLYGHLWRLCH
jgi:hypothetical protein